MGRILLQQPEESRLDKEKYIILGENFSILLRISSTQTFKSLHLIAPFSLRSTHGHYFPGIKDNGRQASRGITVMKFFLNHSLNSGVSEGGRYVDKHLKILRYFELTCRQVIKFSLFGTCCLMR